MSGKVNAGANTAANIGANNRVDRKTSPIPFERYDQIMKHLKDGEYVAAHQFPVQPRHHFLINGLVLGGLGAGIGAMYHYRQPLMKLGEKAYNYAVDKFHNLFANPTNETASLPNPHNW